MPPVIQGDPTSSGLSCEQIGQIVIDNSTGCAYVATDDGEGGCRWELDRVNSSQECLDALRVCLVPGDGTTDWSATGVTTGEGTLTGPATPLGWNKGGTFGCVDGELTLSFTHVDPSATANGMFGLSCTDTNTNWNTIAHAFYLYQFGTNYYYRIYENGAYQSVFGTHAAGDSFEITRTAAGVVEYKVNGSVVHTSANPIACDCVVFDSSIYRNSQIESIQLCGDRNS